MRGWVNLKNGRPDLENVPNTKRLFPQPLSCKVLPKHSPQQRDIRQLLPPILVMLGRIGVNCLLRSTMYGEIYLLVTSQVQFPDGRQQRVS
jgi:hypothetical protein